MLNMGNIIVKNSKVMHNSESTESCDITRHGMEKDVMNNNVVNNIVNNDVVKCTINKTTHQQSNNS